MSHHGVKVRRSRWLRPARRVRRRLRYHAHWLRYTTSAQLYSLLAAVGVIVVGGAAIGVYLLR